MNATFFEENIRDCIEQPDKVISEKYDKAFEELNKSLKQGIEEYLSKERERIVAIAQETEKYRVF